MLYTIRHFLFLVHIEFLSCFSVIRFSNRKKSAGLLCIWKYNRWFILEHIFVKFIHIVYFLYPYILYTYIIHTTPSMLNLQGNKSEMYTKVNYFSRCIYDLYDLNIIIMTYGLLWLLKTILHFSKPLLWVVSWSIYWCNDVSHKMVNFVSGPCVFKFCFLFIFTLVS